MLPPQCDLDAFLQQIDACGDGLQHIVMGFSACLGVPRHSNNDPEFITTSLERSEVRHDRLLDLVEVVVDEDPFAALRLLQVRGVQRLGYIISAPPL